MERVNHARGNKPRGQAQSSQRHDCEDTFPTCSAHCQDVQAGGSGVMDYGDLAFPKPGDLKEPAPAVRILDDGREVCNMMTAAGKREYRRRTLEMRERQDNRCCLCYQWMS